MTEHFSPQMHESDPVNNIFQPYIDGLSRIKKDMIVYLDSLNFSDFHERVLDLESYYSSAITFIHNSEKEYNNLISEINNDIGENDESRLKKINNYKMDFIKDLELEKQRFINKCDEEKKSIIANQVEFN